MKSVIYLLALLCLSSCHMKQPAVAPSPSIDSTLQAKVTNILQQHLSEMDADNGQAIVMDAGTGYIKAMVALQKDDSAFVDAPQLLVKQQCAPLMRFVSLAAILGIDGTTLKDSIDTDNGEYLSNDFDIHDYDYQNGAPVDNGVITLEDGILMNSDIAIIKAVNRVYKKDPKAFFERLLAMDYFATDSVAGLPGLHSIDNITPAKDFWTDDKMDGLVIGRWQSIAPIQTLSFFNIVANNGYYISPKLSMDINPIINNQVINTYVLEKLQGVLRRCVTEGLSSNAASSYTQVSGISGVMKSLDDTYILQFCGYYPSATPQYTIIVSIDKAELPESKEVPATVFKEIVESMVY